MNREMLTFLVTAIAAAGCTPAQAPEEVKASAVVIDKTEARVYRGETIMLTASILPENVTDRTVLWTSSDTVLAEVKDGLVTAKNPGFVYIKATTADKSRSASCLLEIYVNDYYNVSIVDSEGRPIDDAAAMYPGGSLELRAVSDDEKEHTYVWTSSDPEAISVDNGHLSFGAVGADAQHPEYISYGYAKIRVESEDGYYNEQNSYTNILALFKWNDTNVATGSSVSALPSHSVEFALYYNDGTQMREIPSSAYVPMGSSSALSFERDGGKWMATSGETIGQTAVISVSIAGKNFDIAGFTVADKVEGIEFGTQALDENSFQELSF